MANRSDRNSAFPRVLKRLWALGTYETDLHRSDVKKLLIKAHASAKSAQMKTLTEGRKSAPVNTTEEAVSE